jgi:hypothetical protein
VSATGYTRRCIECQQEIDREKAIERVVRAWDNRFRGLIKRARAKHRQRRERLWENYGLTVERYDGMVAEQGGVCFVCGKPNSARRRLVVDHCQETGRVRALLCGRCNWVIGMLEEDATVAGRVLNYIQTGCNRA